jgi:hypothetical protein
MADRLKKARAMSEAAILLPITPYEGIGPIKLGMSRKEVRDILGGDFRSFKKTPYDEVTTDFFDEMGVHVHYKKEEVCEAVEVASPSLPTFQNKPLLGRPFGELRDWFVSIDAGAEIDESGLTSYQLGIGLYAPSAIDDADEPVEGVIVFERGYYDDEPG